MSHYFNKFLKRRTDNRKAIGKGKRVSRGAAMDWLKGRGQRQFWFPVLSKFYVRTGVNLTGFTCANKIIDDVWTAYVNVKSWKFSTFYVNVSLRKQPTFDEVATWALAKRRLSNERRNSILMTGLYPDLGSASDWLKENSSQSEALPRSG